jgi:2-polyprenyl-6-methoxyphenol hydroxylase-like FAD-dependent oxidoreductase
MLERKHAVVLGASMSGLGAARALSRHFEQVTVVERDTLSERVELASRKGVPQGNHGHALLAAGYRILDAYFPGMMDELVAEGASRGDAGGELLFYQFGGWKLRTDIGLTAVVASRPFLEAKVRQHVSRLGNVSFLDGHDVLEPSFDAQRAAVTGVRVKERATDSTRTIDADLVIDTTGRGSVSPKWLGQWGFGEVPESLVKCDVGYATGIFERRAGDCHDAIGALVVGTPPASKRGAGVFAVEGNRWVVTLGCWLRDYPPTELAEFRHYAGTLPSPEVFDIVKDREPLGPLASYRFAANRQRHYEQLQRFPDGYLVMGDAICSFNPLYGQGMSVAMLEAQALDACLAGDGPTLAKRFFARTARIVANPWSIAVGEDLRFPEVEGKRPFGFPLLSRYMEGVHRAACKDPVVLQRFYEVAGLVAEPTSILAPKIALRVLLGGFGTAQSSPAHKVIAQHSVRV